MHNFVVFNSFRESCNYLILGQYGYPTKETPLFLLNPAFISSPPMLPHLLVVTNPLSVYGFVHSGIAYTWNYTVCGSFPSIVFQGSSM